MRPIGKAALNALVIVVLSPALLAYAIAASVFGSHRIFPTASQAMSLWPGVLGAYLRRAFYRRVLPACGRDAWISFLTVFSHPSIRLGEQVYIGIGCMLGDVTVEDDVLIGSHASVINGGRQHDTSRLDVPVRLQPGVFPRITIGQDSWIGDRAVVMADVGRHCVVGAGAIVTKPVPDYAIVAGNPARIIQWRRAPEPRDASALKEDIVDQARSFAERESPKDMEPIAPRPADAVIEGRS